MVFKRGKKRGDGLERGRERDKAECQDCYVPGFFLAHRNAFFGFTFL
jgi:hypothetical protein